ncbi:Endocytosis regulator [Parahypoxylon ruwenzoriense]
MPHRVVDFFRSPNDSIHSIKASVQRRSNPNSRSASRERPSRHSSTSSIHEATAAEHTHNLVHSTAPSVKMADPTKEKHKDVHTHHRLSFPSLHLGSSKSAKEQAQNPNASLDWKIESPPVVMHGDTENSTGALVSGQLLLDVKEDNFEVESFEAKLEVHVIQKRPYTGHCQNCTNQTTELKSWTLLSEPTILSKRTHEFPFSILLEGHLPASTDNAVLAIQYDFTAEVRPRVGPVIKLAKNIDVKRSLPVPELPHHSVRIFPPTNIAASVHYTQVVHPISTNTFTLRLDGIVKHNPDAKSVEYWKLKRLSWKIEENMETVAPACEKHSPKDPETGLPAKKGAKRSDARTIAHADMHGGWKSDYSPTGCIEMEIQCQLAPSAKAICDMKSADGTEVTHQLVVEMVVVQEYAPTAHPKHVTPTGVARILRMHFGVVLTERAGLGVSWDNEAPPIYQDVPPSPPSYSCSIPYESMESVEELNLNMNNPGLNRRSREGAREQSPPYEERPQSRTRDPEERPSST